MKGIIQQIREKENISNSDFTFKDLEEIFKHIESKQIESRLQKEKDRKENINHLIKRSKELNKEIPMELRIMMDPYFNPGLYVGSYIIDKYKEWL